jgi:Ala-tRNA(Pro) deacylase
MKCRERLEQYLREHGVGFEVMTHSQAFTMQEVAAALHVPPCRLNTAEARDLLGVKKVRLAKEEEFADLFPDCATGAMPPFGNLYDVPVYVDPSLAEESNIVFRIGTHRETMKVAYADFARLVQPTVGAFAREI